MTDLSHLLIDLIRGRDEPPDTADVCAEVALLSRCKLIETEPTEEEIYEELDGLWRAGMLALGDRMTWTWCPQRGAEVRQQEMFA